MKTYGIDAVPFQHEKIEEWRDALRKGISYLHKPTNFIVTGAVDDVWITPNGDLLIRGLSLILKLFLMKEMMPG
mgnify:CR=1 FL=1